MRSFNYYMDFSFTFTVWTENKNWNHKFSIKNREIFFFIKVKLCEACRLGSSRLSGTKSNRVSPLKSTIIFKTHFRKTNELNKRTPLFPSNRLENITKLHSIKMCVEEKKNWKKQYPVQLALNSLALMQKQFTLLSLTKQEGEKNNIWGQFYTLKIKRKYVF